MGSARLHGTRRLKNRRVIQTLFQRPGGDDCVRVIRRGLVSARYRILTPGRTPRVPGRSSSAGREDSAPAPPPRSADRRFQFGVAVGRRTGNAVSRNAVKRILRERVRLRQAEIDLAMTARSTATDEYPPPHLFLVMMLVSTGTADDAERIHRDADGVISALIEQLSA